MGLTFCRYINDPSSVCAWPCNVVSCLLCLQRKSNFSQNALKLNTAWCCQMNPREVPEEEQEQHGLLNNGLKCSVGPNQHSVKNCIVPTAVRLLVTKIQCDQIIRGTISYGVLLRSWMLPTTTLLSGLWLRESFPGFVEQALLMSVFV